MRQTIAQALIQEGREIERKEVLINLLQTKFGQLPQNIVQRIQSIQERDRLDTYLRKLLTANHLEEIGIE